MIQNKDSHQLTERKIGELVAEDYRTANVFKSFGLDFCCGGGLSIHEACRRKGVDENAVVETLSELAGSRPDRAYDFKSWSPDLLADFIVQTHHAYVRKQLPLITEYAEKVSKVHGKANPEVVAIARHFRSLAEELTAHMEKEEQVLFPYVKALTRGTPDAARPPFGSVSAPIRMMEDEHEAAGGLLSEIRELSNGFSPPEHACNTWMVLYANLEEFESDLHLHIHLENNILFPKALDMERRMN